MHAIETLAFDIALPDERLAFEAQDRLQAFLKGPALRVIESVFDEASAADETLRLDELVLDLGVLSLDDLPWRWERRLRDALHEQLAAFRRLRAGPARPHAGPRPGVQRLARSEAEYQTLLHYLQAGVLPWQQVPGPVAAPSRWIDAAVLAHWQALVVALGGAPGQGVRAAVAPPQAQARMRQRLALQLSPALWESLQDLISAPPPSLAPQASIHHQGAFDQAQAQGEPDRLRRLLPEPPRPGQDSSGLSLQSARTQARAALRQGNWPDADQVWPLLLAQDSEWLTHEIRVLGRDDGRRERLAEQIDEPRLDDVVALLVPGELGFLGGVRMQLRLVQARAPTATAPPLPPLAPTLRAFTLGFLLADRGSVFNRRSYMARLVRHLAQQQGMEVAALAQSLSQALAAGGAASDLRREMLRTLEGLTEPGSDAAASPGQDGPLERVDQAAPVSAHKPALPWEAQVQAALSQGLSVAELARLCAGGVSEPAPVLARVMALLMARLGRDARWPALLNAGTDGTWLALAARLQPAHGGLLLALGMGGWGAASASGSSVLAEQAALAAAWPGRAERTAFWALWWGQWRAAGTRGLSLRALLQAALLQALRQGQRRAASHGADLQALLAALPVAWRQAVGPLATGAAPWQREMHSLLASWLARARAGHADQGGQQRGSPVRHQRGRQLGQHSDSQVRSQIGSRIGGQIGGQIRGQIGAQIGGQRSVQDSIAGQVKSNARNKRTDRAKPPAWPWSREADAMQQTDPLHIANAGLVLLAAYLPRLFEHLGWVDGQAWRSPALTERAVHLLQWAATGEAAAEEHTLVLNKLLCGLPMQAPVPFDVLLTAEEQATTAGLLQAVIAHWSALGATSVEGLRESFLQREGRLVLLSPDAQPSAWQLQVQARSFDMLLDRLPWSIALIKLPWMEGALHVQWR